MTSCMLLLVCVFSSTPFCIMSSFVFATLPSTASECHPLKNEQMSRNETLHNFGRLLKSKEVALCFFEGLTLPFLASFMAIWRAICLSSLQYINCATSVKIIRVPHLYVLVPLVRIYLHFGVLYFLKKPHWFYRWKAYNTIDL